MMNKRFYAMTFLCIMALCGSLTSCSDDDDDEKDGGNGSSGVKECYFEAENQRTDFKYAYYDPADGRAEFAFSTIDLLYYYQHPEKLKEGTYFASAYLEMDLDNDNNIPTGEIPYGGHGSDEISGYDFEMDTRADLYKIFIEDGDDDTESLWYTNDWNPGYESGAATITKLSGNSYKIEIPSLKLLRGYEGIGNDAPKASGKFYFEGSFTTLEEVDWDGGETSIRKIDNPDFWKWLKTLKKSNSNR